MKARSRSSWTPTKPFRSRSKPASRGPWTCRRCLAELRRQGSRKNVKGMARFGIRARKLYGVAKPKLDALAARVGKNHRLALLLWDSGVHDARILAGIIDEPKLVTAAQMDRWVRDFDNWDVSDGACCHLFAHTGLAWRHALKWSLRSHEFQKRAGFALMAYLAVHDKKASDHQFAALLPVIRREAHDRRNFVRKAVNWALRQIGKRNRKLHRAAIREAERLRGMDCPIARWIAADALRELRSEAVGRRLRRKSAK